ncbi:5651_t:CDS:2, partial [Dentiscutata heterogama]
GEDVELGVSLLIVILSNSGLVGEVEVSADAIKCNFNFFVIPDWEL